MALDERLAVRDEEIVTWRGGKGRAPVDRRGVYPRPLQDPLPVWIAVGGTPQSVEVYAFAPGLDPAKIEVNLERGVLTIAGERTETLRNGDEKSSVHINERFNGRFRRVLSLPDDVDPNAVEADYRDGVLRISIRRRESAMPRRIEIQ